MKKGFYFIGNNDRGDRLQTLAGRVLGFLQKALFVRVAFTALLEPVGG